MRLLSLLAPALLATTGFAADSDSSSSSSSSSSSASKASKSSSSSSSANPEPTPIAQLWTPDWKPSTISSKYTTHCKASTELKAEIYTLGEIYPDLKDFAPELKVFYHRQEYPGSWDGVDKHGNDRELIKMDLADLPFAVREWIKRKEGEQKWFSVQTDVVFFAPGAIYPIMPLFVEEPDDAELGDCEGLFTDLENYSREPKDGGVIARVEHKAAGKNQVLVTIEAMQVKSKGDKARDEL